MITGASFSLTHDVTAALGLALACIVATAAAAPVITSQPADLAVGPGDRAGFAVNAMGTGALAYQWYRNGTAVAGGTADILLLPSAQVSDAGSYTVAVSDVSGTTTSNAATLSVARYATQLIDPTFAPTNSVYFNPIVALPDGRLLVGTSYDAGTAGNRAALLRIQQDGSVDATFPALTAWSNYASITAIAPRDDGKIYIAGYAGSSASVSTPFLYRLNADGSLDASFAAPTLPTVPVALIAVGDKVLTDRNGQLTRLNSDGSLDPTFLFQPRTDGTGATIRLTVAALDPTGRIVVAGGSSLWRVNSDGSMDASFAPVSAGATVTDIAPSSMGILVATRQTTIPYSDTSAMYGTFRLRRYTSTGSVDSTFNEFTYSRGGVDFNQAVARISMQSDGRTIVIGDVTSVSIDPNRRYTRPGVLRLLTDGSLDPNFDPIDLNPALGALPQYNRFVVLPGGHAAVIGTGRISSLKRISLDPIGAPQPPQILQVFPMTPTVLAGDDVTFNVVAVGAGPIQLGVGQIAAVPPAPTGDSVVLKNVQGSGTYSIVAQGTGGIATRDIVLTVAPSAPRFVSEPESITTSVGHDLQFGADVRGTQAISYQWFHDGQPLTGETFPTLTRPSAGAADAGTYVLRATNSLGAAERTATVSFGPTNEFLNISARGFAGPGDQAMILGLTARTQGAKGLVFLGGGSALARKGIANPLSDPELKIFEPGGFSETNDNSFALAATIFPYSGAVVPLWPTRDAAIVTSVNSGAYTAVVDGVGGATGIALGEVFEADATTGQIVNFSARTYVGTGEAITILGFVIRGDKPKRLLIRGVGPGLATLGVSGTLTDPTITLVDQATHQPIASNNDWSVGGTVDAMTAAAGSVGAFPLTPGSKDAALITTLPAGAYTVLVSGADGGTGIALAEVYDLP